MPKLYLHPGSPPCRAVLMVAYEIGLHLDEELVDLPSLEHLKSEFLKVNPQHTVPVLNDDGFVFADSHAIITYLIEKYGNNDTLYPKDLKKRALVDQRLHFDSSVLSARIADVIGPFVYGKASSIRPRELKKTHEAFEFLNSFLQGKQYLTGDNLTAADLSVVATVSTLELGGLIPISSDKYPNLTAWFERMKKLPCYREINQPGLNMVVRLVSSKINKL